MPRHRAGECDRTDPWSRDGHQGWEPRATTDPARIAAGWPATATGKDKAAAETVAGMLLGTGWACGKCGAAYIGTMPESGLCKACADDDGAAGVPVPA